jgi:hypothetical protein
MEAVHSERLDGIKRAVAERKERAIGLAPLEKFT